MERKIHIFIINLFIASFSVQYCLIVIVHLKALLGFYAEFTVWQSFHFSIWMT